MGFEKPTPIQEKAIPVILENKDLIACAQTGTGKTAAFLLPIMNKIIKDHSDTIDTLVIVPTRELAIQIDTALQGFAYFTPITSIAIYGGNDGTSYEQEKKALTQGANIIIATPGRLIAHINQGYAKFKTLKHLVLDEADRMLDMGFSDDLNRIISVLPANRQTLLFSATMPPKIRTLADKILKSPEKINIAISKPAERVIQGAYVVHNAQKVELLRQLLTGKKLKSILIFSSTKSKVKELEKELKGLGMNVSAIGLSSTDVSSAGAASDTLVAVSAAITAVTSLRGRLGAFQANTLDTGLRSLAVTHENLTAAESVIRDVDFAEESAVFTRNQILQQSGTAMLAQANQAPQSILQLLG